MDQQAAASFLNALKFDEKNLDTLFALGISCTNIFEEAKAMYYIKQWYINSYLQKDLPIDPQIVPFQIDNKY